MCIVAILSIPPGVFMMFFHFLQNLHLVKCCLHIVWTALLNLYGNIGVVVEVLAKPHCGEMSPTQFLDHHVAVEQALPDMHGMVTSNLVVFDSLVLRIVIFIKLQQELMEVVQRGTLWFNLCSEVLRKYSFVQVVLLQRIMPAIARLFAQLPKFFVA